MWDLMVGDCRIRLRELPPDTVDSVVCDPPYHLTSIVKRFGGANAAPAQHGTDGAFARASRGFMGKQWDGGDVAFRPDTWAEVFRVLKPQALMRWLCRLVTPPGGLVLDPFAGSGSTGQAAVAEGFDVLMIEQDETYAEDIRRRMNSLTPPTKPA